MRAGAGSLVLDFVAVPSKCTFERIAAVEDEVERARADFVVGVGGGTIIDTVKACAHRTRRPVAVLPTLASTDAPTAAAAVIYDDAGTVVSIETYAEGPAAVVVDTDIIAEAPARYLISGMGDAMATTFEARACLEAEAPVLAGGLGTIAARGIAEQCRSTLLDAAVGAVAFVDGDRDRRRDFENVVEANTLLSGLGFESGGLAAAHAIHNAIKPFSRSTALHGELVAYGLLVHLVLVADENGLNEVLAFNRTVGLPAAAADIDLPVADDAVMDAIVRRACSPDDSMRNMPRPISERDVREAFTVVEAMAPGA
ncbi:glycerol dehydrogenase [Mycolicibacterium helvum]|uniref:Glycerol dehydrogenase n=2 Tax=Mycolicibacterium helvum TaxID=1534349 RepID=A0A7I7SZE3_9MYCO|nr:glycerol dehydrogenase [Mycolicibacterium helvum]